MTPPETASLLEVRLSSGAYPIHVSASGLEGLPAILSPWAGIPSAIVTDENVALHHGEEAEAALRAADVPHRTLVLPPGEQTKSYGQLQALLEWLLAAGVPRDGVVVALGGGVVGDLTGLAASLLRRGVACVQVPTTLIGQVDSAIGGKTAVNSEHGKNLVGTFHQPRAVHAGTLLLRTLPMEELRAGMGEVVKYALLDGEGLLDAVRAATPGILARDPEVLADVVQRCASIKARIVEQDEREGGIRRLLNLGHTVGHAVERALGYGALRHGEAVSVGLVAACELSCERGLADASLAAAIRPLLDQLGLPVRATGLRRSAVRAALVQDKKASARHLRWVLLRGVGRPEVVTEPVEEVDAILGMLEGKGVLQWGPP